MALRLSGLRATGTLVGRIRPSAAIRHNRSLKPALRLPLLQTLGKRLHPRLLAGLNNAGQLVNLPLPKKIANRWRVDEQFK